VTLPTQDTSTATIGQTSHAGIPYLSSVLFGLLGLVQPGEAHGGIERQLGGVEGEMVLRMGWGPQPGE
jgi:hypothetical protein